MSDKHLYQFPKGDSEDCAECGKSPFDPAHISIPGPREAADRILQLTRALEQCVRVAQMWHGDDAFDVYFNHSPEMKLVREALGNMPDPTEVE